jgi:hypothetical protein
MIEQTSVDGLSECIASSARLGHTKSFTVIT